MVRACGGSDRGYPVGKNQRNEAGWEGPHYCLQELRSICAQLVWFGHAEDQIGGTQLERINEMRRAGKVRIIAFKSSFIYPAPDRIYLLIRQSACVLELRSIAMLRFPRRHVAAACDGSDQPGARAYVRVCQQAEDGIRARVMARHTVPIQNRRDVMSERRWGEYQS